MTKLLVKLMHNYVAKRFLMEILATMVERTDNTVDNMIYTALVRALQNEPHGLIKEG